MKNSVIAFSAASLLLISLIIVGTFKTGIVAALTATSTSATSTDAVPAIGLANTASSTPSTSASSTVAALAALTTATSTAPAPVTDNATTTANASSATSSPNQAHPDGNGNLALKRVRVVGSKYVDYFTDGTTTYSFPGDPLLDANLNRPNAPIPVHGNLTWLSTKAMEAYDTPSGDLEPGTYAREANGSFIADVSGAPASATSTTPVAFSLLDPTLDSSAAPPAPKTIEASAPSAPPLIRQSRTDCFDDLSPPEYCSNRLKHA